jgi:murein DD-endopeptidase MepM/ murein hydrolase activator NlpD
MMSEENLVVNENEVHKPIRAKRKSTNIVTKAIKVEKQTEHFLEKEFKINFRKLFILSLAVNFLFTLYVILDKNMFEPMMKKECLMEGYDFCWKSTGAIFDKYFQSLIPLKTYSDGYWKGRIWFDEETKDKYNVPTLLPHEKKSDKVTALSNSMSINLIDKIKRKYQPIWPTNFRSITSLYGWRNMNKWDRIYHSGIDIAMEVRNNIFAFDDGLVILSLDSYRDYGKCIFIQHSYNIVSVYGHLSRRFFKKGDIVQKGDIIALSGNSGYSSGPHLHFELRYNVNKKNLEEFIETLNPLLFVS